MKFEIRPVCKYGNDEDIHEASSMLARYFVDNPDEPYVQLVINQHQYTTDVVVHNPLHMAVASILNYELGLHCHKTNIDVTKKDTTGIEAMQLLCDGYGMRRKSWEEGLYVQYKESIGYGQKSISWRHESNYAPTEPVELTHFLEDDWEVVE
jgi:hypothetical protein